MDSRTSNRAALLEQLDRVTLARRVIAARSNLQRRRAQRALVARCGSEYEAARVLTPLYAEQAAAVGERRP